MVGKVGIIYHPKIEAARVKAGELEGFLVSRGVSVWHCSAWEAEIAKAQLNGTDMILGVGGDGTILRAANIVIPEKIPIVGINLGKLGFMTELGSDEALEKLPSLLSGEGWIDERAMLEAELSTASQEPPLVFHALNDVVVARGAVARLVRIEAAIDDNYLTTYKADGVLAATATGSTGYSLAAGGPVLYPQSSDFLLVPIVSHLCSAHALVLSSTATLRLTVGALYQATLSIDGHMNLTLSGGATVKIKQSPHKVRFLRIHQEDSFYNSLEQRLKGKQ